MKKVKSIKELKKEIKDLKTQCENQSALNLANQKLINQVDDANKRVCELEGTIQTNLERELTYNQELVKHLLAKEITYTSKDGHVTEEWKYPGNNVIRGAYP